MKQERIQGDSMDPNSFNNSLRTNEENDSKIERKRRLSFHANNSRELDDSINREIEIFQSDEPKNKEEVTQFYLKTNMFSFMIKKKKINIYLKSIIKVNSFF
jgi:hypothetical protein